MMSTAAQPGNSLVATFQVAMEMLRQNNYEGAGHLIEKLRCMPAELHALAGFYAEVASARRDLSLDKLDAAAEHVAAASDRLSEAFTTAHAQMALGVIQGSLHIAKMEPAEALSVLDSAWTLGDLVDDPKLCLACAMALFYAFKTLDRWIEAAQWLDTGIELAQRHGYLEHAFDLRVRGAGALCEQGDNLIRLGRAEEARSKWHEAISIFNHLQRDPMREKLGTRMAACLQFDLAGCMARVGQSAEALPIIERCLGMSADIVDHDMHVALRLVQAKALQDLGRVEEAYTAAQVAHNVTIQQKVLRHLCDVLMLLSDIAERRGDLAGALEHLRAFVRTREDLAFEEAQKRSVAIAAKLQMHQALSETERAREHARRMEQEAQIDALTGLANRRRFDRHLATQHAESRKNHLPLCVAMLDVDHFKRVNDTFGHGVGDQVLRRLGEIILAQCRDGDLVARIGGEELAVVFSRIGLRTALDVCERLRSAVELAAWEEVAPGLKVTVSLGLSDIEVYESPEAGLAAADRLLYEAKRTGRNRIAGG